MDCCPAETGCVTVAELIKLEWPEPLKVALRNCRCVLTRLWKDTDRRRRAASSELQNLFSFLLTNLFEIVMLCYYYVVHYILVE